MAKIQKNEIETVKKAVADLGVMFDNVLVMVNRYDPTTEKTIAFSATEGNRFAVIGHASAWLDGMADDDDCECGNCGTDNDLMGDDDDDSPGNC